MIAQTKTYVAAPEGCTGPAGLVEPADVPNDQIIRVSNDPNYGVSNDPQLPLVSP